MQYTSYHIHIGAHEIYPTLLETVANKLATELGSAMTHMVSAENFRTKIRPTLMDATGGVQHVSDLGLSKGNSHVVMSAHGILCGKNAVLTKRGLYAGCERVLGRLQQFFSGEQVSIHFITPPQHDYPMVADAIGDLRTPISWLPIINQISATFPESALTIWPIEKRDDDAVEFCSATLNLKFDPRRRKSVEQLGKQQRHPSGRYAKVDPLNSEHAALSAYLDQVFHEDISSVIASGIARIGLKRVRDEFSVS